MFSMYFILETNKLDPTPLFLYVSLWCVFYVVPMHLSCNQMKFRSKTNEFDANLMFDNKHISLLIPHFFNKMHPHVTLGPRKQCDFSCFNFLWLRIWSNCFEKKRLFLHLLHRVQLVKKYSHANPTKFLNIVYPFCVAGVLENDEYALVHERWTVSVFVSWIGFESFDSLLFS